MKHDPEHDLEIGAAFSDSSGETFFVSADEEHVRREKAKAKQIRAAQWWKNELGRGLCHYCQERFHPRELTMDHVVPIIRGGMSRKGNLVPACKKCNDQKKYLLPVEWQQYLDNLQNKKE